MTPVESAIADKILTNSINLYRLTAGERKKVIIILRKMQKELIGNLSDVDVNVRKQAKAYIKESAQIINDYYVGLNVGLNDTLQGLAEHTAEVTNAAFTGVGMATAMPTETMLKSIVSDALIMGSPSKDWWAKQSDDTVFKFSAQVRQGIAQGESTQEIARRIKDIVAVSESNASALVHTSVQTVSNDARMATFQANEDSLEGVQQLSTFDSHTSDICIAYSGASYDMQGNPINGTTLPMGSIPRHFNCLPGDSLISSASDITGMSKRWFDGEVIVIKTSSGRELTCTPNHPILTNDGWVAANKINIGGYVISDSFGERGRFRNCNNEDVPTSIHEVTESFLSSRGVTSVPVPFSSEDFHGDGACGKIGVVFSDSLLSNKADSSSCEHIGESVFVNRNSTGTGIFKSFCGLLKPLLTGWLTSSCNIGIIGKIFSLLYRCYAHSSVLLLRPISCFNAVFGKYALNNISRASKYLANTSNANSRIEKFLSFFYINADCLRSYFCTRIFKMPANGGSPDIKHASNLINGFSRNIFCDKVVSINRRPFHDFVYNLETKKGWYVANGIITHNCRSVWVPLVKSVKGLDVGTRFSEVGFIKANTTMDEFLKMKTKEQQDDMLGKGKADLWRSGKITLSDLVNQRSRPLTLAELKKL